MKKLILLLVPFLFFACNQSNKLNKDYLDAAPQFYPYISSYTSGTVSKNVPISVKLRTPINELPKNILQFSPRLDGELSLGKDSQTLIFVPSEPLKGGKVYTGKLNLKKLVTDIDKKLAEFKFQIQVIKQDFSFKIYGMKPYSGKKLKYNQIKGELNTADAINPEELNGILAAKQAGKNFSVKWQSASSNKHYFTIDSAVRNSSSQEIDFTFNGKSAGVDRKETTQYSIPAINSFELINSRVVTGDEPYVSLIFSDPIKKQGLTGLIEFENDGPGVKNLEVDLNEIKVYPSTNRTGDYKLLVNKGVQNYAGVKLKKSSSQLVTLEDNKPKIELIGDGNIIPHSDKLLFPFYATALKGVHISIFKVYENNVIQFFQENDYDGTYNLRQVGRPVFEKDIYLTQKGGLDLNEKNLFSLDLSKFIKPEQGAIYRVDLSMRPHLSNYKCMNGNAQKEVEEEEADDWENDYYSNYFYPDGYEWSKRKDPCHVSYYTSRKTVSRNIIASNFGIVAKQTNNKELDLTISDLRSTAPLSGIMVKVYDYQQQVIAETQTDGKGFVRIKLKRKPFVVVAQKGKEKGYLKLGYGSALNMSRFDINGVTTKNGLKAFIYGERGVWRPGDSIHLTCVLHNAVKALPKSYPITLELYNPENQLIEKKINAQSENGFYTFDLKTAVDAPTGNWNAVIKAGGSRFSKRVKIETVKPNKLKIKLDFNRELLSETNNTANLNVAWLHGAKASNLKANVTATLQNAPTKFKKFENYHFDNPGRRFEMDERVVFNSNVNAEGSASFPVKLNLGSTQPSGMLKLGLFTKVFEKGGEFSTHFQSKTYSPYSSYVGMFVSYTYPDWNMLETGKKHRIAIATVDENGNKLSKSGIRVRLYKMKNNWWYSRSEGSNEYISAYYSELISEEVVSTSNGLGYYEMNVSNDKWGRYMLKVEDPASGHISAQIFRVDWADWRSRGSMGDEVATLSFEADKEKYNVGETAEIVIPTSASGRALLSIENGTTILEKRWIKTEDKQTKVKIKLTPEMTPNVYAHITLIQPHAQTANDLPIRLYGVAPIMVEDPNSHIHPVIKTPKSIQPQQDFTVTVSEKNRKEMTYTLAVVDEGLLDLTSFKTPDIWGHFHKKEALGVRTWDMYHAVLGAFDGKMANVFAVGGSDDAMKVLDKANMNRFKPVVKFIGPFTVPKGKSRSHKIHMPNYIGSVKVMVVAGNQSNQFGNAMADVKVKQPLMLTTTLPRVLSPGETVNLPITLFADKGINNATVSIKTNDLLQPEQTQFNISLRPEEETMLYVPVKVPAKMGIASIKVTAKSGKYMSTEEVNIPVRLPNPPITQVTSEGLEKGTSKSLEYQLFGVQGTNKVTLEVSSMPNINLTKRLSYLMQYPHGCVEQTTSSVFPQLHLSSLLELDMETKGKIEANVNAGISRLRSMQLNNGGIGYWPGANMANDWGTNYAGHFMMAAEKKGYALPVGFKKAWLKYQKTRSNQWNSRASANGYGLGSHQLNQAYRLYTLALAGKPNLGAMNRMREDDKLTSQAAWRLAAAYALAGKQTIAKNLITKHPKFENYSNPYYYYYTYGSATRDQAMKLETYAIMKEFGAGMPVFNQVTQALRNERWMSTQTTAYALLAVAQFAGEKSQKGLSFTYETSDGKSNTYNSTTAKMARIKLKAKSGSVNVKNTNGTRLFVNLINQGTALDANIPTSNKNLKMTVSYQDMKGNSINEKSLNQGTDFKAVVTITNTNTIGNYRDLALSQIFPSGWEIINLRLNDRSSVHTQSIPTYQDIRDDRVYTYFDLRINESKTFVVLLNASYKGTYHLPAVECEAMYNNDIQAVQTNAKVEVK